MTTVLAIETSCDDTSLGIVETDGQNFHISQLIAYSQITDHQAFGGVVPEIASRLHSEKIVALIEQIGLDVIAKVDHIAVTATPGLPGSLLVGMTAAQSLSVHFHKLVVPVNHIHGHLFSLLCERGRSDLPLPRCILSASGGHNELYHITSRDGTNKWNQLVITKLGQTLDDAAGECFDKVARMLGGSYPGGPRISTQALPGHPNDLIHFKRILLDQGPNRHNFSFSGMKSQVHQLLSTLSKSQILLSDGLVSDICYEFQECMTDILCTKLLDAVSCHEVQTIGIVGGVSANDRLFEKVQQLIAKGRPHRGLRPTKKVYSTDNAAMIGVVGLIMGRGDVDLQK